MRYSPHPEPTSRTPAVGRAEGDHPGGQLEAGQRASSSSHTQDGTNGSGGVVEMPRDHNLRQRYPPLLEARTELEVRIRDDKGPLFQSAKDHILSEFLACELDVDMGSTGFPVKVFTAISQEGPNLHSERLQEAKGSIVGDEATVVAGIPDLYSIQRGRHFRRHSEVVSSGMGEGDDSAIVPDEARDLEGILGVRIPRDAKPQKMKVPCTCELDAGDKEAVGVGHAAAFLYIGGGLSRVKILGVLGHAEERVAHSPSQLHKLAQGEFGVAGIGRMDVEETFEQGHRSIAGDSASIQRAWAADPPTGSPRASCVVRKDG